MTDRDSDKYSGFSDRQLEDLIAKKDLSDAERKLVVQEMETRFLMQHVPPPLPSPPSPARGETGLPNQPPWESMYCPKCGTQLPDDAAFCVKCGTPQRIQASRSQADPPTRENAGWNDRFRQWARPTAPEPPPPDPSELLKTCPRCGGTLKPSGGGLLNSSKKLVCTSCKYGWFPSELLKR
jgi:hypothetical protein